jgi:hypothetical protein
MTQEEKKVLFRDLCGRLPYKVIVCRKCNQWSNGIFVGNFCVNEELSCTNLRLFQNMKPYLRPMSNMTEEEKSIYHSFCECDDGDFTGEILYFDTIESFDYLNQIHIDYRNLIPRGLAIEATKEMYGTKKNE